MMDYDELVKRLRASRHGLCSEDPKMYVAMITVAEAQDIADAIETLRRERDEARKAAVIAQEDGVSMMLETLDAMKDERDAAIARAASAEALLDGGLADECRRCGCQNDSWKAHYEAILGLLSKAEGALNQLLRRDEINTCQHDETHRGGVLWEICDSCGAKWADDEGGKPEWKDPQEWIDARDIISKIKIEMKNHDDGQAKD